jgi:hypothetical protein
MLIAGQQTQLLHTALFCFAARARTKTWLDSSQSARCKPLDTLSSLTPTKKLVKSNTSLNLQCITADILEVETLAVFMP